MGVTRGLMTGAVGLVLAGSTAASLSACATPKELKRPIGHPVMGPVSDPDPLPAYVRPQPESVPDQP